MCSSYKIRSRNTFNKITTNIRLLMQNKVNNWQYVGIFTLTYKAKHNLLASLHELARQFKKFVWIGNCPQ